MFCSPNIIRLLEPQVKSGENPLMRRNMFFFKVSFGKRNIYCQWIVWIIELDGCMSLFILAKFDQIFYLHCLLDQKSSKQRNPTQTPVKNFCLNPTPGQPKEILGDDLFFSSFPGDSNLQLGLRVTSLNKSLCTSWSLKLFTFKKIIIPGWKS